MFLVHDNDLVLLDGIHDSEGAVSRSSYSTPSLVFTFSFLQQSLESLQLDALLSHLRKAMPKIHQIPFDLGELLATSRTFLFLTAGRPPKRSVLCQL